MRLLLLLLSLTFLPLFACGSDTGELGNLAFSAAEGSIHTPIADGARFDVSVHHPQPLRGIGSISAASSTDPGVFDVVSTSGNTIVLEATGPGSAHLEVTSTERGDDRIALSVETATSMDYYIVAAASGQSLRAAWLPDETFGMLPGSCMTVTVGYRGSDGDTLGGYGLHDFEGDTLTISSDGAERNAVEVCESGDVGDDARLTYGPDVFDIELRSTTEVSRLGLIAGDPRDRPMTLPAGMGEVSVSANGWTIAHVAAFASDGMYLYGSLGADLDVTVDNRRLIDMQPLTEQDAGLADFRAWFIDGDEAGTSTLRASWGSLETSNTLRVR